MELAEPFVGRARELAELRRLLRAASGGRGALVLLEGEAGAGKTTLVRRVMAEPGAVLPVFGHCPGPGETPPFGPWLEVVAAVSRRAEREADGLPPPFGEAHGGWSPYETALALARWLGGTGRPLAVVLEDLHWADAATLDLTRYLGPALSELPVLVVATIRTDEVHRRHPLWAWLPEAVRAGAVRMPLEGLAPEEIEELIRPLHLPGVRAVEAAQLLYRRTHGLPLLVRDLLATAARTGRVMREGEPLPATVRQAIDRRLARISPEGQSALEAAAVLGPDFSAVFLGQVTGIPDEALAALLEEAVDGHVIEPLDLSGDRFAFTHALIREGLLGRLLGPRRRRWHARAAAVLEATAQGDVEALAFHLVQARDPRAPAFLRLAGDRALRLGAVGEAEMRYEKALGLLGPGDPTRLELLLKLGWCRRSTGHPGAVDAWREAAETAAARGNRAVEVWARHMLVGVALQVNEPRCLEEAAAVMEAEEELLADPDFRRLEEEIFGAAAGYPRAGASRVVILADRGRLDEARALLAHLCSREVPGASHDLLNAGMMVALVSSDLEEAAALCGKASETALRLGDHRSALRLKANQLMVRLVGSALPAAEVDELAAALRHLEEEVLERAGISYVPPGFSLTGVYQYFRGDWPGAWHNVVECARRDPGAYGGTLRWYAGWMLFNSGDPVGARPFLESVPPFRPEDSVAVSHNFLVLAHAIRAELYLALGDRERAQRWLEAAESWPPLAGAALFFRANVRLARAKYHRVLGEREAAWEVASLALADARGCASSYSAIRVGRFLGEMAFELGKAEEGLAHFAAALELAQRCRFRFEAALTRLARGRALAGSSEGTADLAAAREVLAGTAAAALLPAADGSLAAAGLPPAARAGGLTPREVEVVALVAQGLPDRQIAARLAISPRTVDRHLRNIFQKLDLPNRTTLALWAARHGMKD